MLSCQTSSNREKEKNRVHLAASAKNFKKKEREKQRERERGETDARLIAQLARKKNLVSIQSSFTNFAVTAKISKREIIKRSEEVKLLFFFFGEIKDV
jgi:hypothetical protein